MACAACGQPCSLVSHGGSIDGRRWRCRPCMTPKSVRDGSFFSGSHLSLRQLILVVYCWARDMRQTAIMHEASLDSKHTVVDWCNFLREECESWLTNHPQTETATPIWHVSHFVSIFSARVCFLQQVPRLGHVSHNAEDNCWELSTLTNFFPHLLTALDIFVPRTCFCDPSWSFGVEF